MCIVTCGQENVTLSIIPLPRNGLAQLCTLSPHYHCFWLTKKLACWKVKVGDSTMVRLFEILQQILVKSLDRETQLLDAVKSICDANIKVYQEILNTSGRLAYSSAIDQHAQQGIEKMRSVKRQFQEDDDQDTAAVKSDTVMF
jgi:hypothetical protein